jgi:FXSXX-COOH protein
VTFESDVIDLGDIDLTALRQVPSAALRAAIVRVRAELSSDDEQSAVYADFRSSLRVRRAANTAGQDPIGNDEADKDAEALG